jgi:hypothetical protein
MLAARAADDTFMGVAVAPISGTYLVLTDVNIRARPKTASKRVGRLSKGSRVDAVGRPKDAAWLAVRRAGKDLGFVYAPALMPLIDGTITTDIAGEAPGAGVTCAYVIRFEGKAAVEGELFESADYVVTFSCERGANRLTFSGFMFMPQAPFKLSDDPIFQVTIDLRELGDCCEETFSTVVLYDRRRAKVVFDGVSVKHLGGVPATRQRRARTLTEALTGTVELALSAWNVKLWETLAAAAR